jgi:RsiW-degrading membrane proteinase PrsW (M82 family)
LRGEWRRRAPGAARQARGAIDIQTALAIVFTVLPIVALLRYFYTRDMCREPRVALAKTFLLGLLVTIPAVPLSLGLSAILPLFSPGPLLAALYDAFIVAAVPEELLKLLVVALYCARRASFDEPMDGVVYGATAALGFAALENVLYVAGGGLTAALVRSVTAVPMHAMMGAVLGYYVARARFEGGRRINTWKGLGIAVLMHGLYDFSPMALSRLTAKETPPAGMGLLFLGLFLLFLGVVITSGLSMRRLIQRLRTAQLAVQLHAQEGNPAARTLPTPVDSSGTSEGTRPAASEAEEHRPVDKRDQQASDGLR